MDHYGCGASIFGKPRKLRSALAATGVRAERALCVGDETRDAEAAASAGIDFIGVGWGYALPQALQRHAGRPPLQTLPELLPLVLGQR